MSDWTPFRIGSKRGLGQPEKAEPSTPAATAEPEPPTSHPVTPEPSPPASDEPESSTLSPAEPEPKSAVDRRRKISIIVLGACAVVAVLLLVTFLVGPYSKEMHGKSANSPTSLPTARMLLGAIPVKGRAPLTGYSRVQFGRPWTDAVDVELGRNGCDTRDDILRRDLSNIVRDGRCKVLSGVLHDPYTGKDIRFNRDEGTNVLVQIDHVVPLMDAWQKGAQGWDENKRVQFANDPLNLLAVSGKANREKKAGDVATWLPPNDSFRCAYVARVVDVKYKYGLWMTQTEHEKASQILAKCSPGVVSSGVRTSVGYLPPSGVAPSSGVLPSTGILFPPSSANRRYPN